MPNVDSSGKTGRSMDYSMYLKRKRHTVLTSGYRLKSEAGNPMFGRDKKTRGFDNGIVTVLFEKGLTVGSRSGSGSRTYTATYIAADGVEAPTVLLDAGAPSEVITYFSEYVQALAVYPGTQFDPTTLSNFQQIAPFIYTTTNNTKSETYTLTLIGDPATDKAASEGDPGYTENNGDSITVTITFG